MKSLRNTLFAFTAAAALALSVLAQQPASSQQNQSMQGMQGMQGMQSGQMQHGKQGQMNTMMQGCHKNMQSMMQANDQATKQIEAAKQTNDPAKMRTALDTAEKALNGMNNQMKTCQSMMNMMGNMHGMMSGATTGGQSSTSDRPPRQ